MLFAVGGDGTSVVDENLQVILLLGTLLSTVVAALVYLVKGYGNSKIAAEQSTAANRAVNDIGPGDHRLYDKVTMIAEDTHTNRKAIEKLIANQEQFDAHGWENLPQDMDDAVSLTEKIRGLERGRDSNAEKIDQILAELRQHVAWEMAEKYPRPTDNK